MAFQFVDRIVQINRNQSIKALRYLSSTEQYLKDHFRKFPVMPGVLILESTVQVASWLWRYSEDFEPACIALTEVSKVKYGQFVKPGDKLEIKADLIGQNDNESDFQASASLNGKAAIRVKFRLKKRPLVGSNETWGKSGEEIREIYRERFKEISREAILA
ncbi:MAG: beta-hydroxyacyl-ACP dehydratase [Candidatus Omnitrophica bacterium]|nr:beta-hydroxyacyl-ACP dehydratase [Candidatus Omnitrophota bacterium]